jgi:hypothetical protein
MLTFDLGVIPVPARHWTAVEVAPLVDGTFTPSEMGIF